MGTGVVANETQVTTVKADIPAWYKWVLLLAVIAAAVALIWTVMLSRTVDKLERHNRALVRWAAEVTTFSEGVSAALWGPGGDPCCVPPKAPPELQ